MAFNCMMVVIGSTSITMVLPNVSCTKISCMFDVCDKTRSCFGPLLDSSTMSIALASRPVTLPADATVTISVARVVLVCLCTSNGYCLQISILSVGIAAGESRSLMMQWLVYCSRATSLSKLSCSIACTSSHVSGVSRPSSSEVQVSNWLCTS